MSDPRNAASQVKAIAEHVEQRFRAGRRVLSFAEFLALFDEQPVRYSRDASRYLAFVEVHIEQGPVLTTLDLPLAAVTSINGSLR